MAATVTDMWAKIEHHEGRWVARIWYILDDYFPGYKHSSGVVLSARSREKVERKTERAMRRLRVKFSYPDESYVYRLPGSRKES